MPPSTESGASLLCRGYAQHRMACTEVDGDVLWATKSVSDLITRLSGDGRGVAMRTHPSKATGFCFPSHFRETFSSLATICSAVASDTPTFSAVAFSSYKAQEKG